MTRRCSVRQLARWPDTSQAGLSYPAAACVVGTAVRPSAGRFADGPASEILRLRAV